MSAARDAGRARPARLTAASQLGVPEHRSTGIRIEVAEEGPHAAGERGGVGRPGREPPGPPRRIDTTSLLQREREIVIVHRGQEYRLRVTRSDKLILTK